MSSSPDSGDSWQERLAEVVETMRELSRQSDPQEMINVYSARMRRFVEMDRMISVSRRGIEPPGYLIARNSDWEVERNPWEERHLLPRLEGGLIGELLYSKEPRLIDDLDVPESDPGHEYLAGMRSLLSIPIYDAGDCFNVGIFMRRSMGAFDAEKFPEMVWTTNLIGRVTHNLVLSRQLEKVNRALDHELETVARIQKELLPAEIPEVPGLDIAVDYRTSRHAGGDYYDVIRLDDGRVGILVADVSGHGTPAAVIMAITHSLAHCYAGPSETPAGLLAYVNRHMYTRYTGTSGMFVTAFYAVFDPTDRSIVYANAGHNPPRLLRGENPVATPLDATGGPPLGILEDVGYEDERVHLEQGDRLVLYTDGISEARDREGRFFGVERLDEAAGSAVTAEAGRRAVFEAVDRFSGGRPRVDDQTLLLLRVT